MIKWSVIALIAPAIIVFLFSFDENATIAGLAAWYVVTYSGLIELLNRCGDHDKTSETMVTVKVCVLLLVMSVGRLLFWDFKFALAQPTTAAILTLEEEKLFNDDVQKCRELGHPKFKMIYNPARIPRITIICNKGEE